MQAQSTTVNAAGARPVSCDILVLERFVNAYDAVREAILLLDAAQSLIDLSGGVVGSLAGSDGDELTNQVSALINSARFNLNPIKTAFARGNLGEIGGAA